MIRISTYRVGSPSLEQWWIAFMNEMWRRASVSHPSSIREQDWYVEVERHMSQELARYQAQVDDPESSFPDLIFPDQESATAFQLTWS